MRKILKSNMSVTKSNYLKEWPQEIYLEQLGMAWVESDYEPPKKATVEDMETQILDLLDGKEKRSIDFRD